jgi:hypothetical protein
MNDIPISKYIVYEFNWSKALLSRTCTTIVDMIAELRQGDTLPEDEAQIEVERLAQMEQAGVILHGVVGEHWFCLRTSDKAVADRFGGFIEARDDHEGAYVELRRREGRKIDPETAILEWWYTEALDPYGLGLNDDLPSCIGRDWFARRPDSHIWVNFGDLPDHVREKLQRSKRGSKPLTNSP